MSTHEEHAALTAAFRGAGLTAQQTDHVVLALDRFIAAAVEHFSHAEHKGSRSHHRKAEE